MIGISFCGKGGKRMARRQKMPNRSQGSVILKTLNLFTAFVYSLFSGGRMSEQLSFGDNMYQNGFLTGIGRNVTRRTREICESYTEGLVERSGMLRLTNVFRSFLATLGLNVYGIFFMAYSLTAVFMYYVPIMLNGHNQHGFSALIVAVVGFVCSLPLMTTSRSLSAVVSESRIIRKLLLSFLGMPAEKLRSTRAISGTEYMFMSAVIAVLCGVFTYFIHPAYIPLVFVVLIVICLVSSNPETGVILSVAMTPFLQFSEYADVLLLAMIFLTAVSYISKLIRRRRVINCSAETVFLMIFCAFVLVASAFSKGDTVLAALQSVIFMLGGFVLSYNLMRGERHISSCVKIMEVSFILLCLAGIWNVFYNGIADGVIYSMRESVQPIFERNIIYIADSVKVFSVYAVLVAPTIFAYAAKRKSARGVVFSLLLIVLTVATACVYGSYETVVALVVEFCIFWLLYSHKSLTFLLLAAIPVGILAILYPYLSDAFGLPDIGGMIEGLMPLPFAESATHESTVKSTWEMLKDGNLTGIGVGENAFMSYYPAYSDMISADPTTAPTLWLKVLCWSGLGGLLAFVLFGIYTLLNSLGFLMRSERKKFRIDTLALFCGFFTALLFGMITGVWENGRMLYLFWAMAGLLAGAVRDGRANNVQHSAVLADTANESDFELRF